MTLTAVAGVGPVLLVDGATQFTLSKLVMSLTVDETTDGLATAEITVDNRDPGAGDVELYIDDRGLVDFGTRIQIDIGSSRSAERLFDGIVTGLRSRMATDAPPTWTILAEDHLAPMRHGTTTGSQHERDTVEIIEDLVQTNDLDLDLAVDHESAEHDVIAWVGRSDHDLLAARAGSLALDVTSTGTTVHVASRPAASPPAVLKLGANLTDFEVTADLAEQVGAVTVRGWDPELKAPATATAGPAALDGELQGVDGATIHLQVFGDRPMLTDDAHVGDVDGARQRAEAEVRRRGRRFVRGRGSTTGTPVIRAGMRAEIAGVGSVFSGEYHVTVVRHLFDSVRGFRTEFDAERPGVGT